MNDLLGHLEKVHLREIWASEADDFTPWLGERQNLSRLANTIGLELELHSIEERIGPFRADIVCKDIATDRLVLIENQLERTDHSHLGQLLTYAAGLDAVTIIWIAERFTNEHRAALDWLNEITNSNINFFGLEIEVWRIGNSYAPKFILVGHPNDWKKTNSVRARTVNTELPNSGQQTREYWLQFNQHLLDRL